MRLALLSLAVAALAVPRPAAGQAPDGPIVTDRPDFTESAAAVPYGRFQLEAGLTYADADGGDGVEIGEALARIGVRPGWEIRLQAPSRVTGPGEAGFSDPAVGFKAELPPAAGADLALLAMASLPLGSGDAGGESWTPEALLAAAWTLADPWGIAVNLGLAVPEDGADRRAVGSASVALGVGLSERWGGYLEAYGFVDEDGGGPVYADAGLTFLVHDDFQLDARVGAGVAETDGDWLVGVGASRRW